MNFAKKVAVSFVFLVLTILFVNFIMYHAIEHDLNSYIPSAIGSIYDNADRESRLVVHEAFNDICLSVSSTLNNALVEESCRPDKIEELKDMCSNYEDLPEQLKTTDLERACDEVSSGQKEEFCRIYFEEYDQLELIKIQCDYYLNETMDDREMLISFLNLSLTNNMQNGEPTTGNINTINAVQEMVYENTLFSIINFILLILFSYLAYLISTKNLFLKKYSKILINLGVFLLIPLILVRVLITRLEPDTSELLLFMFSNQEQSITFEALKIVPFLVYDLLTTKLVVISIFFILIGVFLRYYIMNNNEEETKT